MHNALSGKRKAKTTLLLEQGTAPKKLREEGTDEQAADTANDAHSGAEAVRVVAAEEDGVDAATVEAEHRALEARCERPTRSTVAEAVATAPAPKGMVLKRRRETVVPMHPALPFAEEGKERRNRRWRGDGRTTVAKATSTPGRRTGAVGHRRVKPLGPNGALIPPGRGPCTSHTFTVYVVEASWLASLGLCQHCGRVSQRISLQPRTGRNPAVRRYTPTWKSYPARQCVPRRHTHWAWK